MLVCTNLGGGYSTSWMLETNILLKFIKCSSLIARKMESLEISITLQKSTTHFKWCQSYWFSTCGIPNRYHCVDFNLIFICFLHALYRLNSLVHWVADYVNISPSIICMHIFRGSLVYVMWESSFVIYSTPHTQDHKIWSSLVLLMSFLSVFDSKGEEFVGPKASPIIIIYKW
jgi:hypothetical protein